MGADVLPVVAGPADGATWQAGLLNSRFTFQGEDYRICECSGALFDGARAWVAETEQVVALTLTNRTVYVYVRSRDFPERFVIDQQASQEVTQKYQEDQDGGDCGRGKRRRRRK